MPSQTICDVTWQEPSSAQQRPRHAVAVQVAPLPPYLPPMLMQSLGVRIWHTAFESQHAPRGGQFAAAQVTPSPAYSPAATWQSEIDVRTHVPFDSQQAPGR